MSVVTSLFDFIQDLLFDREAREDFERDPEEYLRDHDLEDVTAEEVYEAFLLVYDGLPANVAKQIGSFDRTVSAGSGRVTTNQYAETSAPHLPLAEPRHGETELEAAIRQVSYITNNYSTTEVDDRDTILDNSVNQQIFAKGDVDLDQTFDNDPIVASGDGAVAAGDDITGRVVTGDDNVVGDDNVLAADGGVAAGRDIRDSQVITGENSGLAANQSDVDDVVVGDENRVAQDSNAVGFGDGDVSQAYLDDVTVDDGGALSVGGDAYGYNDKSREYEDSFNQDNDDVRINDSFQDNSEENDIDVTVEDSFQDNDTEDNDVVDIDEIDVL